MLRIHVLARPEQNGLRLWHDPHPDASQGPASEGRLRSDDAHGLRVWDVCIDHQLHEPAHFKVHRDTPNEHRRSAGPIVQDQWEPDEHTKTVPRQANYTYPSDIYCAEGAARVLIADPYLVQRTHVAVHLITSRTYADGKVFIWHPGQPGREVAVSSTEQHGVVFNVVLLPHEQSWFLFKFVDKNGAHEPDHANRLYCAADGADVWVHSRAAGISSAPTARVPLVVRTLPFTAAGGRAVLHLWQADSDLSLSVASSAVEAGGWVRFETDVYAGLSYGFMFRDDADEPQWESNEARRNASVSSSNETWTVNGQGRKRLIGDTGIWTLEGDHQLFGAPPVANKDVVVSVAEADPSGAFASATTLDVWVNRGRTLLHQGLQANVAGQWQFKTYPEVVTSFVFRSGEEVEAVPRHTLKVVTAEIQPLRRYIVLGRAEPLANPPISPLFLDPTFPLTRPGAWIDGDKLRFVVHCPTASSVHVMGQWTNWEQQPIALHSTRDGTFWWGEIAVQTVTSTLQRSDVHGVMYKYLINQVLAVQDPAADWVENSAPDRASLLVDHSRYTWRSNGWQRPGWEYLIVYQAHPNAFSVQNNIPGFDALTHELTTDDGYLKSLNATALLLMPVAEYAMKNGWGYNPSFYYAVEESYGGPDALKRLVDACHERGIAVLIDVVFNHAGTGDNVLWSVARNSYFDGDTEWGAMINFDHPQVIHFFEQNLVHFMRNYRIDGFRFDFTHVIRFGQHYANHVRVPGSGGGAAFLQRLKAAAYAVDGRCLFMAEEFPNDPEFTGPFAPMDTQWHDKFHDRLVEASRGWDVMTPLADALQATQGNGEQWYEITNYPESHDEVGNTNDRISAVAGMGQGYRRNKVAAAATLFARGIPMWFMGAEYGEHRQFQKDGSGPIDLNVEGDDRGNVRRFWNRLCELRKGNPRVQGPAPIGVQYAQDHMLAFTRGNNAEYFVLLNFSAWSGRRSLTELNLPDGEYKELLNSTWGDYRIRSEGESERSNGGWDAHLDRGHWLNVPAYSAVVLERR